MLLRPFLLMATIGMPRTETAWSQIAVQIAAGECERLDDRSDSFSGSMTTNAGTVVERIGRRDGERVVRKSFGDLRVCMVTVGLVRDPDDRPSRWAAQSDRVILETRTPNDVRTLDVGKGSVTYTVNGAERPFDAAARQWRDDLLGLLDPLWERGILRGKVSSLNGEISSIQGERSSLEGRISSYRGEVSSMNGQISSLRGQVASMQGEIASIRGREASLTNERDRRDYDADGRVREVQRRIDAFDVDAKVAEIERRIRDFDLEARVAQVRTQIDRLDVDGQVGRIQAEIRSLDEPARSRELEDRCNEALARLKRTIGFRG